MKRVCQFFLASVLGFFPGFASACPRIHGLVDMNCDRVLKIAVTGDSIVRGRGDPKITGSTGGYVRILSSSYRDAIVENLGVAGTTSRSLYRAFLANTPRQRKTWEKIKDADYFMIEVGTNDFWDGDPPAKTIRNIGRIEQYLKTYSKKNFGSAPLVFSSTLPPTSRGFQAPFIASVNELLLLPVYKEKLNVLVSFDQLSTEILSADGLHPNLIGYRQMARIVAQVLRGPVQTQAILSRPDRDGDGVYDEFETIKFGTSLQEYDSDHDALSDGEELFEFGTDPLKADTDGDGKTDGDEVAQGGDPLDPLS